MDPAVEQALLVRLGQGDTEAFDALYDAYRPRLHAFLVRLSRRREVAEDLLEETWLRLVANASSLGDGRPLGPWLFTVARNLFISYCRSRLLEAERVAELTRLSTEPRPGESPFEALAASESQARLERALARLSRADREVLMMIGIEGFSHGQAASLLEIAPEALRQRLCRARARLEREIEAETAGEPASGRRR